MLYLRIIQMGIMKSWSQTWRNILYYVQSEEKNNLKDYYSPFKNISAPSVKDLYFTKIEYNLGKNISASSLMSNLQN